ncbi:transposase [Rhizobium ruizarguesonis]|uniref:transposase n=1 Tax=Rhizobium ruizarguesonis TaxID=2081791 RepID=UPI0013EE84B5
MATAFAPSVPDLPAFRSGRDLSPWIGLGPQEKLERRQGSLEGIVKAGNRYLRRLLVIGARRYVASVVVRERRWWSRRLITHLYQSAQGKGRPTIRQALRARALPGPNLRRALWPAPCSAPHPTAGHMQLRPAACKKSKPLANPEPSTLGAERTYVS